VDGKTCSRCGETKPLTGFYRAAHGRGGYAAECKACHQGRKNPPLRAAVLTCAHCAKEFPNPILQGPDRKFCSPLCKEQYWRAEYQRRRQAAPPRACIKCGGPVAHRTGRAVCADCRIDDRTRPYKRALHLKRTFGITIDDFDRMLAEQGGRCAICRAESPGSRGDWPVDHDRVTGQVRGLLCNSCNLGIGYLQHDPEIIMAAARYIAAHRESEAARAAGRTTPTRTPAPGR
jgi:hypothetical protein